MKLDLDALERATEWRYTELPASDISALVSIARAAVAWRDARDAKITNGYARKVFAEQDRIIARLRDAGL